MKVCVYCGSTVGDEALVCPNCSATAFRYKCPQCGREIEGSYCPDCAARQAEERERAQREDMREAAVEKANMGLAWKTALTVFMPFIGGYFLIKDEVRPGFKVFAIVWCALLALSIGSTEGGSAGGNALAVLMCLAPIGVYFYRMRDKLKDKNERVARIGLVAFGLLLVFSLMGGVASADAVGSGAEEAGEAVPTTKTIASDSGTESVPGQVGEVSGADSDAVMPAVESEAEAAKSAAAATAAESEAEAAKSAATVTVDESEAAKVVVAATAAGAAKAAEEEAKAAKQVQARQAQAQVRQALADATLTPVSEYLEYSAKDVDPVSLVECSNAEMLVSSSDAVDLSSVGAQTVGYQLSLDGQSVTKNVSFTVRDTKKPTIKLADANPKIEYGASFDPREYIESVSDKVDGGLAYIAEEPSKQDGDDVGFEQVYEDGWYTVDGAVDATTPGTYSLIVRAVDKHGNAKTKEMLVTVGEAPQEEAASTEAEQGAPKYTYIANLNTHKFHIPGCRDVSRMNEENRWEVEATYEEMISWGYSPCGHCLR